MIQTLITIFLTIQLIIIHPKTFEGVITYEIYDDDFKPTRNYNSYLVKGYNIVSKLEKSDFSGGINKIDSGIFYVKQNSQQKYYLYSIKKNDPNYFQKVTYFDSASNAKFTYQHTETNFINRSNNLKVKITQSYSLDSKNKFNKKLAYLGDTKFTFNGELIKISKTNSKNDYLNQSEYYVLKDIQEKPIEDSEFILDPEFEVVNMKK